jgi:hypothetical protein
MLRKVSKPSKSFKEPPQQSLPHQAQRRTLPQRLHLKLFLPQQRRQLNRLLSLKRRLL